MRFCGQRFRCLMMDRVPFHSQRTWKLAPMKTLSNVTLPHCQGVKISRAQNLPERTNLLPADRRKIRSRAGPSRSTPRRTSAALGDDSGGEKTARI